MAEFSAAGYTVVQIPETGATQKIFNTWDVEKERMGAGIQGKLYNNFNDIYLHSPKGPTEIVWETIENGADETVEANWVAITTVGNAGTLTLNPGGEVLFNVNVNKRFRLKVKGYAAELELHPDCQINERIPL